MEKEVKRRKPARSKKPKKTYQKPLLLYPMKFEDVVSKVLHYKPKKHSLKA